jgi:hypothetical protein
MNPAMCAGRRGQSKCGIVAAHIPEGGEMGSYYNRPVVLHVEEFALGEWYSVLESERGSVEAAVKVAQARTPVRQWRVVDAGGNIHEAGAPSEDQGRNVDDSIHVRESIGHSVHEVLDYATDIEKGRVHISESFRRRLLEESLEIEALLERRG